MSPADPVPVIPPAEPRRSGRRALFNLVKLGVTGGLLYLVLTRINLADATSRLLTAQPAPLAVAVLLAMIVPFVLALRWWLLTRPLISGRDAVTYTWIGLFYGLILPGGISGDIAKGSLLAWQNDRTRQARLPASILMDRLIGFAVMLAFFCGSCLLLATSARTSPELIRFVWPAFSLGALGLGALLLLWWPRAQRLLGALTRRLPGQALRNNLLRFTEATLAYSHQPRLLLQTACISGLSHGLSVIMQYLLLRSLQIELGLVSVLALYSVFSVLGMIPVSIAGIGLRDWFAIHFFAAHQLTAEAGVAFTWLCLAMSLLQAVLGGLCQLLLIQPKMIPRR